jgi:hypothetical protein
VRNDDFGPCDCGEIEVWPGNAEITRDEFGQNVRHSQYGCRVVKPKPRPSPSTPEGQREEPSP